MSEDLKLKILQLAEFTALCRETEQAIHHAKLSWWRRLWRAKTHERKTFDSDYPKTKESSALDELVAEGLLELAATDIRSTGRLDKESNSMLLEVRLCKYFYCITDEGRKVLKDKNMNTTRKDPENINGKVINIEDFRKKN